MLLTGFLCLFGWFGFVFSSFFFSLYIQNYRQNNCRGRSHGTFSAAAGCFSENRNEKYLVLASLLLVTSHFWNKYKKKTNKKQQTNTKQQQKKKNTFKKIHFQSILRLTIFSIYQTHWWPPLNWEHDWVSYKGLVDFHKALWIIGLDL